MPPDTLRNIAIIHHDQKHSILYYILYKHSILQEACLPPHLTETRARHAHGALHDHAPI